MTIPCQVDDLADSPEFRNRATEIMRRHTLAIVDNVEELGSLGLVKDVSAQVRVHRAAPLFKLYMINNEEAFFGFYPVREHIITLGGTPRAIYDLMGKDAILFHHSITDDDTSTGSQYVDQARTWFDSVLEHHLHGVHPVSPGTTDPHTLRRILARVAALSARLRRPRVQRLRRYPRRYRGQSALRSPRRRRPQ